MKAMHKTVCTFPSRQAKATGSPNTMRSFAEPAGLSAEARLLEKFRTLDSADLEMCRQLENRLRDARGPLQLWYLLCCCDHIPARTVNLEFLFSALKRLAESDCELLRFAAYRRLANLHSVDLCFANRAKLALSQGLKRETGRLKKRLENLLDCC